MAQISYSSSPAPGIPGQLGDTSYSRKSSRVNENASAINVGIFVKHGTAVNGANLLAAATDVIDGIALRSNSHPITSTLTGTLSVDNEEVFEVMEMGAAWMFSDTLAPAVGGPVYARFAAGVAGGTVIGTACSGNDSNTAKLVPGARCTKTGTSALGAAICLIVFDKTANDAGSPDVDFDVSLAQVTSTTTTVVAHTRADRQFVVDAVEIDILATGISADNSNYYVFTLQVGSTVIASWKTATTGGQGALTAGAWASLVMGALASTVVPPGSEIDFVATLTGTKTQPAALLMVHGHYV